MKTARLVAVSAVLALGACGGDQLAQPDLEGIEAQFAKSARAACRPHVVAPGANEGSVTADDCLFNNGVTDQYEDLYMVSQGRLGTRDGNVMATFSLEAETFDWIFGLGGFVGKEIFPTPVYAFRRGPAGVYQAPNGFVVNTFSVIGGEPTYKLWVGGQGPNQLGDYTLTATAEPVTNTCVKGHRVYLQGDVTFTSSIDNETSCRGTVAFGEFIGAPLNYQYWWIRVSEGDVITLDLSGVQDATVAAAIIDFGTGQAVLDLGDGPGDGDRSVTFTAQRRTDIYVEVSSMPDAVSGYTATVNGPDTR